MTILLQVKRYTYNLLFLLQNDALPLRRPLVKRMAVVDVRRLPSKSVRASERINSGSAEWVWMKPNKPWLLPNKPWIKK